MRIYVIRHAHSELEGEGGDFSRPLTERGKGQARSLGQALRAFEAKIRLILASPARRAVETAQLVADALEPAPKVMPLDVLYQGQPKEILKALAPHAAQGDVALVGHAPTVETFSGLLVSSQGAKLNFSLSSVACVKFEGALAFGEGELRWLMSPEKMGRAAGIS